MKSTATRTIRACGKQSRIAMSLSNYLYLPHKEAIEEFKATINSQPLDAAKIARALNNHPDRLKRFEPYRFFNNEHQVVILATDFCGNEDLIYITENA